jgi:chemotaxis protein histidine kinase CheA
VSLSGARDGTFTVSQGVEMGRPSLLHASAWRSRDVPLIPVLVARATMPQAEQLPESVRDFAYRNGIQVDAGQDFDNHITRLTRAMDRLLEIKAAGDTVAVLRGGPVSEIDLSADAADQSPPMAAPLSAAVTVPPPAVLPREPRRRGHLALGLAAGALLGAAAVTAVVLLVRPGTPADLMALAAAKEAAEAKALVLQAELTAAQKKAATAQTALDAAQKQAADLEKRQHDLQASADQAAKDLAAQKDIAAKAQTQVDQLTAQLKTLGDQQARVDQAEKDLAAQREIAAKSQAQLDRMAKELAAQKEAAANAPAQLHQTAKELAAAKETAAKAQAQVETLTAEVKSLREQAAAPPAAVSPTAAQPAAPEISALAAAATPTPDGATLTIDQRREVQRALRLLGHYQADQRKTLLDMAQRLSALLDQPPQSPQGTAASAVRGAEARFARAYNFANGRGVKADPAEAAYWYALAAGDGHSKAFTNLGTLLARGVGDAKPDPASAELLWWAAAARGEAIAMYDLGALYERGIGVPADLDRAKSWYQRAAALNDPDAKAALKRLGA